MEAKKKIYHDLLKIGQQYLQYACFYIIDIFFLSAMHIWGLKNPMVKNTVNCFVLLLLFASGLTAVLCRCRITTLVGLGSDDMLVKD